MQNANCDKCVPTIVYLLLDVASEDVMISIVAAVYLNIVESPRMLLHSCLQAVHFL
jgi:hypothetical protein